MNSVGPDISCRMDSHTNTCTCILEMVDFCNALFQAGVCLFVSKFGIVANCDSHIIIIIIIIMSPTCSSLWENKVITSDI